MKDNSLEQATTQSEIQSTTIYSRKATNKISLDQATDDFNND